MPENNSIAAFCHIIKAGGTTVTSFFRRNHGLCHLDTQPGRHRDEYLLADLRRDMKLFPSVRSLSGHGLRPYIDYGEFSNRLIWITWLREPVNRLISGYQHSIEKRGMSENFEGWLKQPGHKNRLVFTLTGTESDLQVAKEILKNKIRFFGLVERFDESLLMLRKYMDWEDFNIDYKRPRNLAKKGEVSHRIKDNIHEYEDLIQENTAIDQELYKWAVEELYPLQVKNYGATELEIDILSAFPRKDIPIKERINEGLNNTVRKYFYKPYVSLVG